jgi:hypothetical protein
MPSSRDKPRPSAAARAFGWRPKGRRVKSSRPTESERFNSPVSPELAERIVKRLLHGRVTPVLGAGANLCDRPEDLGEWTHGCGFYPSGAELARHLAIECGVPGEDDHNLMEVATSVELSFGRAPAYEMLRDVFNIDGTPTILHRFIARARVVSRATLPAADAPLVVTTNYDDALERALDEAGEAFDVIAYVADGPGRGRFRHLASGGNAVVIDDPDGYRAIPLDERPTILKLHGTIDRSDERGDSYVIAEDQYVEYLATDVWVAIPRVLRDRLKATHLLFLGYALRDWNLLVVLKRLGILPPRYASWAVQLNPSINDTERWKRRNVECLDTDIADFVSALDAALAAQR